MPTNISDIFDLKAILKNIPFISSLKMKKLSMMKVAKVEDTAFTAQLPYFSYDMEKGIFVNKSTVGIGLSMMGLLGASPESVKLLINLLQKLSPEGEELYLQFMRYTHHQFFDRLQAIESASAQKGGMYEAFAKYNTQFLLNLAKQGLKTKAGYNLTLNDTHCYVFISTPFKAGNLDDKIELLDSIKKEALSDPMFAELKINQLLGLMQSIVNVYPNRTRFPDPHYDELNPLADQICKTNFKIIQDEDKLNISFLEHPNHYPDHVHSQVVAMNIESFPQQFSLWNIPECFASIRNQHLGLQCPHIFTLNFKFHKKFEAKEKAGRMVRTLEKYTNPAYAKFVYNKKYEYQDWKSMQDFLEQSDVNITFSDVHTSILLLTNNKNRRADIRSAQDIFTTAGFLVAPKDGAQLFQMLSALPFMPGEGYFDDAKALSMRNTMTNWNVANLLPVVTDWRGSHTGLVIPTPRHQLTAFDPFDTSLPLENTNIVVAATSGSGKSFLMQAIVRNVLSRNGKVWIIDRGNSYKKTCELLGGIYIDKDSLNLNPFTFLPEDPDALKFALIGVRDLLACMTSPEDPTTQESLQYLLNAVTQVFDLKGREANIDDVHQVLMEMYEKEDAINRDRRIYDLALKLERYTSTQMYGKYFNKGSLLDPTKDLVVIELGEFDATPDLQKAILCALIMHISEEMYHSGTARPKQCIIDEAWAFLDGKNPTTARFIETGFRTSRKHKGSFVVITQDFDVFFNQSQPLAMTAYNCSAIRIVMRQNRDRFRQFCQNNEGIFNSYEQTVIEGFQEAKTAGFSGFCIKTDAFTSFHRLVVDPVSRIMFSTEPNQVQAVKSHIDGGEDTFSAIYKVAQQYFPDEMKQYGDSL